ncbi:MAG: glycosyltransferase [Nanoarchaeota archaeon]|nr:glycosyltransferase [Nanoarchaeota archaeon]
MINIIGNILGTSGYDIHTRQLANALNKYVDVRLVTQVPPGAEGQLSDKELEMVKRKDFDINLIITNPIYWRNYLTAKRNWVFLVWEGNKIPKSFINECLNLDIEYIFVPSTHTKKAVENTVCDLFWDKFTKEELMNKIKVIPHGVNLDLFFSKEKPKDKFRFLCNKGFRNMEDRGGIQYAVQAYLEEFSKNDDIEMIVKINPAYPIGDLNKLIKQVAPKRNDLPHLQINAQALPYDKMVHLYNSAHVFVSPTRADAFNLPVAESMACELMPLTTNFGGQVDYVNTDNGMLIDYELTEIKHEVTYEGIRWATPNISDLRKKMRWCYENQEEVTIKAKKALKDIKNWTWDETSKKINQLI